MSERRRMVRTAIAASVAATRRVRWLPPAGYPPTRMLVASGNGDFVPDDPTGPTDLSVAFDDAGLTLTGPSGSVVLRRAP